MSTAGTFGGEAKIGDFIGAYTAIQALANGGSPFQRDAITEGLSDLFEEEFDNINLVPVMELTGEVWIDLGSFSADGQAAITPGTKATITGTPAPLGNVSDKPLKTTTSPQLNFSGTTITRQNAAYTGQLTFTQVGISSGILTPAYITGPNWSSLGFNVGDTLTISGANDGNFNGEYIIGDIDGNRLYPAEGKGDYAANFIGNLSGTSFGNNNSATASDLIHSWISDGFAAGQTITVQGAAPMSGPIRLSPSHLTH